jgi:hypothetical protein
MIGIVGSARVKSSIGDRGLTEDRGRKRRIAAGCGWPGEWQLDPTSLLVVCSGVCGVRSKQLCV